MAEKIKKGDFVEIEYDGFIAEDNVMFDTTDEKKAVLNHIHTQDSTFGPMTVCIGKNQIMKAIDDGLEGFEIGAEKKIEVKSENAFGKKESSLLKLVPISIFKKEKMQPFPGLQISVDGQFGVIKTVSGGRVIVDFNHPLAGKDIYYNVKPIRIVGRDDEKIVSFLSMTLNMPKALIGIKMEGKHAEIKLPFNVPKEIGEKLEEEVKKVIGIDKMSFVEEKPKEHGSHKDEEGKGHSHEHKDTHGRSPNDPHYGHNHQ